MTGKMCGRFSLMTEFCELQARFRFADNLEGILPRFNIAPGQDVLTVVAGEGLNDAEIMEWGFKSHFKGDGRLMINARGESLDEKASFRNAFWGSRCIIPADGFYEWRSIDGRKYPYYIRMRDAAPFGFAGLYSGGACTIITTRPNEVVSPIHERMPVILPAESEEAWLNPENHDTGGLKSLFKPYPEGEMESFPVSRKINDPAYDGGGVLEKTNIIEQVISQKKLDDYF